MKIIHVYKGHGKNKKYSILVDSQIDSIEDRDSSFEIIKFRTMMKVTADDEKSLPDEKRLTAFGKFLRSTSIDEIPELKHIKS